MPQIQRLYRIAWYGAAALVIATAVLMTVARLLLPAVESYRLAVQGLLSGYVGQPVTIGEMDAHLLGLSPAITFHDASLLSRDDAQPLAQVGELRVAFDPIASLRQGRLVLGDLTIRGARLVLERQADGNLQVRGVTARSGAGAESGPDGGLAGWLQAQPSITIEKSSLEWRDPVRGVSFVFPDITVELENDGDRHRLSAQAGLPPGVGHRIQLAVDMRGDITRPSAWEGALYTKVSTLRPIGFGYALDYQGLTLEEAVLELEAWTEWHGGGIARVAGSIGLHQVALRHGDRRELFERLLADVAWTPTEAGWSLDVAQLRVRRDGRDWTPGRLHVDHSPAGSTAAVQFLRVEDVAAAALLWPGLPAQARELLTELRPAGDLADLYLTRAADGALSAQAGFRDLAVEPWQRAPGVRGVDGALAFAGDSGWVRLDTTGASVSLPRLFRDALPVARLSGTVAIERRADEWVVQSPQLDFANTDIGGEVGLDLRLPAGGGAPFVDLRGAFRNGRAAAVPRYLPAHIMPPGTVAWLDRAFGGGRVVGGSVLLHGRTSDFPFRKGQGRFQVRFLTEGVDLAFHPEWPHLTGVAADVTFDGPALTIDSRAGHLYGGALGATRVAIPDLLAARLYVDGQGTLSGADALRLLREAPLLGGARDGLAGMSAGGGAGVELHLEVPLRPADRKPLVVRGAVTLDDTRLAVGGGVELSHLNGTLRFDGTAFAADDLKANLFDGPVSLAVRTGGSPATTSITARGEANGATLGRRLQFPLADRLHGKSAWEAELALPQVAKGDAVVRVRSDLRGMAVRLPAPLGKSAAAHSPLDLTRYLGGRQAGRVDLAYGDKVRAVFGAGGDRAALHFGTRMPALPARGIRLTGTLRGVAIDEWRPVLAALGGDGPAQPVTVAMERLDLEPVRERRSGAAGEFDLPPLDLRIERFAYGELALGRVGLNARPVAGGIDFSDLSVTAPSFALNGSGRYRRGPGKGATEAELRLETGDIGKMMRALGFVTVITKGEGRAEGSFSWPGSPPAFAMAGLGGRMRVALKEGTIEEVEPGGGGRLLGLFSLAALPKRLRLDFSDFFKKGLGFDAIKGTLNIRDGDLHTEDLTLESPSSKVLMSGRTGLAREDYDLVATISPNVGDSVAVASGLAFGPQAGALVWIFQKLFSVDKAAAFQYRVVGPWSAPEITRLKETGDR